ncbi:hypothetical protein L6Q21_12255 [Sandaracinobacter sp. RS1-74]|uniref:hypothetical protein n=1 Tax=Sandaracinobacteroides sayramensis TaxID=2913411 RepID=UPI001EDC732C|nr:hypothetical protein [Sandaracinobacteroides sayramensis]MCG2841755.1 hypothetical protein [Sandaracinobacteroides sayramensis]
MQDGPIFPKQWCLLSEPARKEPRGAKVVNGLVGLHLYAHPDLPCIRIRTTEGREIAAILGWVIFDGVYHVKDADLTVPENRLDELLDEAGGAFVVIREAAEGRYFQLNIAGALPAVFSAAHGLIASTTTMASLFADFEDDAEVREIFNFPKSRGFLPFGLTARRGLERLHPNHRLHLSSFSVQRVWPQPAFAALDRDQPIETQPLVADIAARVRRNTEAVLTAGKAVMNLSGGNDSRMALAACRNMRDRLETQTFVTPGDREGAMAARVAQVAGVAHHKIPLTESSAQSIEAWLHRTGYTIFENVAKMTDCVVATDRGLQPIGGTCAELTRATSWNGEDLGHKSLPVERLLYMIRIPDVPRVHEAAERWLAGLPPCDRVFALDLAKIEQIHSNWAASSIYGHKLDRPTIYPFVGVKIYESILSLPNGYRLNNGFFRDYISLLWPELLQAPVNKVTGMDRLIYWKQELKDMIPTNVRRIIRPFR